MTDDAPTLDPEALDRLLEMTGGDPEFVDELVRTFLEDAEAQLATLSASAAAGNVEDLVRPAHSLKSNSASVGAMRLSEMARGLEAAARSGVVEDAVDRVAAAEAEFRAARADLQVARAASRQASGGS